MGQPLSLTTQPRVGPSPALPSGPHRPLLDSWCIQQVGQACPVDLQVLQGQKGAVRLEGARSPG